VKGDWKIVRKNNEAWELYNLRDDPTEIEDLAAIRSGKVSEMEIITTLFSTVSKRI
jgi:arylsulfatase A-like enzyme